METDAASKPNWITLIAQSLFILVLINWTFSMLKTYLPGDAPWIALNFADLIFHEAGHFIFIFLGDFMHVIGGSLNQVLIPGIVLVAFLRERQWFAAGFAIFWLGENLVNVAYYIGDSRALLLPLITGDENTHDWHYLLTMMNLLNQDTLIAHAVLIMGGAVMIGGIGAMAYRSYLDGVYLFTPKQN